MPAGTASALPLPFVLVLLATACGGGGSGGSSGGATSSGGGPRVVSLARYFDADASATAGPGDRLVIDFDAPVRVRFSDPTALSLPVEGDSLGIGAEVLQGPGERQVTVRLGAGARLRTRGKFTDDGSGESTSPRSPSGVDVSGLAGAIEDAVTGADARPSSPIDIVPGLGEGAALGTPPASCAAVGDLDADGALDLVVGHLSGGFSVLKRAPSGELEVRGLFGNAPVLALRVADVDRDGRPEVVLGVDGPDEVWANGAPDPTDLAFALAGTLPPDRATRSLALADLDGDGDLDLAAASDVGLGVHRNDGAGGFDAGQVLAGDAAAAVVAADVDRDGDVDLLAGAAGVRLWRNDGEAVFSDEGLVLGSQPVNALEAADIDGDGDLDLVACEQDGLRVGRCADDGSFVESAGPDGLERAGAVAFGDVDADGFADLFVGLPGATAMLVNDRAGGFVDSLDRPEVPGPGGFAAGDLDGDGDLDLATVPGTAAPRVARGSLAGTFGGLGFRLSPLSPGPGATRAIAMEDLDRDGRLDLATGSHRKVRVWTTSAPGGLEDPPIELMFPDVRVQDVGFADLDRDGDLDLVVVGSGPAAGGIYTRLGDGAGGFVDPGGAGTQAAAIFAGPTSCALGDLDLDGDPDLVVGLRAGQADLVLVNRGRDASGWAGFEAPVSLPGAMSTRDVALADVDGDGDLDLVSVHEEGVADRLWRNDGSGGLTLDPLVLSEADGREISLGDLDRDGDVDFVLATGGGLELWRGEGNGLFTYVAHVDPSLSTSVRLADLDGDGDLDLFAGQRHGRGLVVWLNDGDGGFGGAPFRRLPHQAVRSVAVGDLDRDGDPDVVAGSSLAIPNRVWLAR